MFKKFLYYFLDEEGRSYYTQGKNVQKSAVPRPLEQTPDGWQEVSVGYERDLKNHAVDRSFTLPLSTVRALKRILRTIAFTVNLEQKVFLLIQKLTTSSTDTTYRRFYQFLYKGRVNLHTFRYEDVTDQFSLIEAGIAPPVRANESTTYELDIDSDPEVVRVKMDGINLTDSGSYNAGEDVEVSNKVFGNFWCAPVSFINNEGKASNVAFLSQFVQGLDSMTFAGALALDNCILQASSGNTGPVEVHVTGTLKYRVVKNDPNGGFRMRFATSTQTTTNQNDYVISGFGNQVDQVYLVPVDMTIPLAPGEKLFLHGIYFGMATGAIEISVGFLNGSALKFSYTGKYRTTYINALKPSTVLKRLMNRITGADGNCDTTYTEQFDHLVLTSGDAIRGLAGAKLKTSLASFTDFMRVVAGAGRMLASDKLFFKEYTQFYNPANPVPLGEVSGLKVYPFEEVKGNTLKIGYPESRTDDVNGKAGFNNTHLYTSPLSEPVKELNFVCPYLTDAYYIEITRINLEGKTTTDDQADNEVFILNTKINQQNCEVSFGSFFGAYSMGISGGAALLDYLRAGAKFEIVGVNAGVYTVTGSGVDATGLNLIVFIDGVFNTLTTDLVNVDLIFSTRILRRVVYDSITGIPDPEFIFNIEGLTPKRLVLLQSNLLNSLFYGHTGEKLTYQTTEKNADLVTRKDGVTIRERADYVIGNDNLLFKPWIFEFTVRPPFDIVEVLEGNPNQCFSFTWYGYTYKGFIRNAGTNINDGRAQSFRLICSADTDLTPLIDTHG